MNRFVFKLEPLFNYRQRLEELSRKELGVAIAKLEEEEEKLEGLKDVYRRSAAEIDKMKEQGSDLKDIDLWYNHIEGLKIHIGEQERIISEFRVEFEKRREEFVEASKDKKVIETLKDRSLRSYTKELEKQEQKATDDIVSSRFKRDEKNEI